MPIEECRLTNCQVPIAIGNQQSPNPNRQSAIRSMVNSIGTLQSAICNAPAGAVEQTPATKPDDAHYWERVFGMQPASVTIVRRSDEDFTQRQLIVWLDGERLGDLMFGDAFTRDVHPGPHKLRVSNTLVWKTVEFTVKPGEQVRFEAINKPGRLTFPMLAVMGVGPLYVSLKRVS